MWYKAVISIVKAVIYMLHGGYEAGVIRKLYKGVKGAEV